MIRVDLIKEAQHDPSLDLALKGFAISSKKEKFLHEQKLKAINKAGLVAIVKEVNDQINDVQEWNEDQLLMYLLNHYETEVFTWQTYKKQVADYKDSILEIVYKNKCIPILLNDLQADQCSFFANGSRVAVVSVFA